MRRSAAREDIPSFNQVQERSNAELRNTQLTFEVSDVTSFEMTNDVQSPAMGKAGTDPYASMVSRLQKTMPAHVDGQVGVHDSVLVSETKTPGKGTRTPQAGDKGMVSPLVDVTNGAMAQTPSPAGSHRKSRKSPGTSRVSPRVPRRGLDSKSRETAQLRQLNALLLKRVSYQRDLQRTLEEMQASSERMRNDLRNQLVRKDAALDNHRAEIKSQAEQLKAYEAQIAELKELLKSSKEETVCIRETSDTLQAELEKRETALEESRFIADQLEQKFEGTQKVVRLSFEKIKELEEKQGAAEAAVRSAAARAATFSEVLDKIVLGAQEQDARHAAALRRLSEEATAASEESRKNLLESANEIERLRDIISTKDKVEWGLRKKLADAKKGIATLSKEVNEQANTAASQKKKILQHVETLREEAVSLKQQAKEAEKMALSRDNEAKENAQRAADLDALLVEKKEQLCRAEQLAQELGQIAETHRAELAEKTDLISKKSTEAQVARKVIAKLKGDLQEAEHEANAKIAQARKEVEMAESRAQEARTTAHQLKTEADRWQEKSQKLQTQLAKAEKQLLIEREEAEANAALAKQEYEESLLAMTTAHNLAYQAALQESEKFNAKNQDLTRKLTATNDELDRLKAKLELARREKSEIDQQLKNNLKDNGQRIKKLHDLREKDIAQAVTKVAQLEAEIQRLTGELTASKDLQSSTDKLVKQLEAELDNEKKGHVLKRSEVAIARSLATQLRSDFLTLKNAHHMQRNELDEANSTKSRALQEAAVSRSVIAQLKVEVRKQEESLLSVQNKLCAAQKDRSLAQQHIRGLMRTLKIKEATLSQLEQTAKESAMSFSVLQKDAALTKEELQESEQKCLKLSEDACRHRKACLSLVAQVEELKERESHLLAQIDESSDKNAMLVEEVGSVRAALEEQRYRNEQLRSELKVSKNDGNAKLESIQRALDVSRRASTVLQEENSFLRAKIVEVESNADSKIQELYIKLQEANRARDFEATRAEQAMKEAKIARGVIEELKIRAAKEQHEASAIIDSLKEEIHEKDEHMKNVQCALETAIQERDAAQKLKEEYASALEAARKDATSFKQQMEASFKQIEEKEELAQHLRADLGRTLQALDTADASLEKMELQSHKAITEKQHVIHKLQQELKDVRAEAQQNNATIKATEKSLREQLANYESELVMTKSQLAAEVASRSELDKQVRTHASNSEYLQGNVENLSQLVQAKEALIRNLKGELEEVLQQSSHREVTAKGAEEDLRQKLHSANQELHKCREALGAEKTAREDMEGRLRCSLSKARSLEQQVYALSEEAGQLRENLDENKEERHRLVQIEISLDLARRKLREEREKNARMAVMLQEAESRAQNALIKVSKALAKAKGAGLISSESKKEVACAKKDAAAAGFAAIVSVSTLVVMVTSAVTGMRY